MTMCYTTFVILKKYYTAIAVLFFIVISTAGGFYAGYVAGTRTYGEVTFMSHFKNTTTSGDIISTPLNDQTANNFGAYWKVWQVLDQNFTPTDDRKVQAADVQTKINASIAGLVSSYNDPYTVFIPKAQAQQFKERVNGGFSGIGAVLNLSSNTVLVMGVLTGSPAEKAGLKAGDSILSIDNTPISGETLEEVVTKIRGVEGSVVNLSVLPKHAKTSVAVAVTRGTIVIPTTATRVVSNIKTTVASAIQAGKDVAHTVGQSAGALFGTPSPHESAADKAAHDVFVMQLATFSRSSKDSFLKDLGNFKKSGAGTLVIDLRGDPGGYMDVAVDFASYFLPKGALVVTEKTGHEQASTTYQSLGYDLISKELKKTKVAVLVNHDSASASEIFAGALQDSGVAKIIGTQTYGKGSAQQLIDIGDAGSLKITIARWYTPKGRTISGVGITPDVVVTPNASSTDPIMDAALDALK